jgi:hypothetical protein
VATRRTPAKKVAKKAAKKAAPSRRELERRAAEREARRVAREAERRAEARREARRLARERKKREERRLAREAERKAAARREARRLAREEAARRLEARRAAARRGWEARRAREAEEARKKAAEEAAKLRRKEERKRKKAEAEEKKRRERAERAREGWRRRHIAMGPSPFFREAWEELGGTIEDLGHGDWEAMLSFPVNESDPQDTWLSAEEVTRELIRAEARAWCGGSFMVADDELDNPKRYRRTFGLSTISTPSYRTENVGAMFIAGAEILEDCTGASVEVMGMALRVMWSRDRPNWKEL